jgi:hypothetical protein
MLLRFLVAATPSQSQLKEYAHFTMHANHGNACPFSEHQQSGGACEAAL